MTLDEKRNNFNNIVIRLVQLRKDPNALVCELESTYKEAVKQYRDCMFDITLNNWLDTAGAYLTTDVFMIDTDEFAEEQIELYLQNVV